MDYCGIGRGKVGFVTHRPIASGVLPSTTRRPPVLDALMRA